MSMSINNQLVTLSREYYISAGTNEANKIVASVNTLKKRLKSYFEEEVIDVIEFGSYKRDTILPRYYDDNSDVDLMVVFDHENIDVNPSTYRNYLVEFSEDYYGNSIFYKSLPTLVLELDHIKYDLVPAYQRAGYVFSSSVVTYIPESDRDWMETDPHGFNTSLTQKNQNNYNQIKPLIRLMKAWNAKVGYPIESFTLEKEIVNDGYFSSTLEEYFFSFIRGISTYRDSTNASQKVIALKENANRVVQALYNNNIDQANTWLSHILPL